MVLSGQPSANDTITLNGTTITFVSGAPSGNQVQIAGTAVLTLSALAALINGSADVQLVKFKAAINTVATLTMTLAAATAGTGGNALTIAKSCANMTLSGATLAGGSATDISGMLAMLSTSSGAYLVPWAAAETAIAAITALDAGWGAKWYGVVVPSAADADHLAIAAYIEAATIKHYYALTTAEAGMLVASDTTNIAYQLKQLAYNHTNAQFSSTSNYAAVSQLARILPTNWTGNATAISLAYKQEPGIIAESLNVNQLAAIHGFNGNVFVNYANGTAILDPLVVSSSGQPVDTIIGLDSFAITLQTNVYNLIYLSPTKIPQTDAGNALIATAIEATCQQYVTNGLFAPGLWNQPAFGGIKTGQFLPKGFYVYTPPIGSQSSAVRATRTSVAFQVAVCLAGSVEKVNVAITVQV